MTGQKIARQREVTSNFPQVGLPVSGYEIHQGRSRRVDDQSSYKDLFDEPSLGMVDSSQLIWGAYLHGIFDNGPWRRAWLNRLRQQRGLKSLPTGVPNYREQREAMLDSLAATVRTHLDLKQILSS